MAPEEGMLLWARPDGAAGPGSVELLRAAVRELKLGVHCCTYGELPELIRTRRCELVGIELDADAEPAVALIKRLHDRLPALTIFAASDDPSISLLRALLEAGASDVLSLPLGSQELHKALIKFSQPRAKTGPAQAAGSVLTVYGVRGGLGATTLGVLRPQFRYAVVDTGRTITGPALAAFEQSDRLLMLTDLSVPGVRAARRIVALLDRLNIPRERVDLVVTQAIPGPVSLPDAARAIGKEVFHVLPRDEQAAGAAMNAGTPLPAAREAGLATGIAELADKLAGRGGPAKGKRGHLLQRIFTRETRA